MIKAEELDSTKQFFRLCPDTSIHIVENDQKSNHNPTEPVEHNNTFENILNASNRFIANEDRSFLLFDLGAVISQYERLRKLLPRIYPFYALKCMADKMIISLLASLGAGFDCASWDEIRNSSIALRKPQGTFPEKYHFNNAEKIIFSHPFKFESEMNTACRAGVEFTVFDTVEELRLISTAWPSAKLLIRIKPLKRFKAYAQLGDKFGAEKSEIVELIKMARKLNLNLCGVSFHVGSGVEEMNAWTSCIEYCSDIFRMMEEKDYRPYVLDIGGGFPGFLMYQPERKAQLQKDFEHMCAELNRLIDEYFPAEENYLVICELGTYFMQGSACLFFQVIGENIFDSEQTPTTVEGEKLNPATHTYILNNSRFISIEYGCCMNLISMKDYIRNRRTVELRDSDEPKYSSRMLGYSVDEHDCILPEIELPRLSLGDWLVSPDKGAYTDVHNDLPTTFCGSTGVPHYYCISRAQLNRLHHLILHKQVCLPNYHVLNSTNRDSIVYKFTRNCNVM